MSQWTLGKFVWAHPPSNSNDQQYVISSVQYTNSSRFTLASVQLTMSNGQLKRSQKIAQIACGAPLSAFHTRQHYGLGMNSYLYDFIASLNQALDITFGYLLSIVFNRRQFEIFYVYARRLQKPPCDRVEEVCFVLPLDENGKRWVTRISHSHHLSIHIARFIVFSAKQ